MLALEITILALICVIIYSVIATMWIFCPQVLIRWADYFAIKIKNPQDNLAPIFVDEDKDKPIEVKEVIR